VVVGAVSVLLELEVSIGWVAGAELVLEVVGVVSTTGSGATVVLKLFVT
jgi:hypothetical protein